jgi:hypothetical protein
LEEFQEACALSQAFAEEESKLPLRSRDAAIALHHGAVRLFKTWSQRQRLGQGFVLSSEVAA